MSEKISNALKRKIKSQIKISAFTGTVETINLNDNTCDVKLSNGEIRYDVRLSSSTSEQEKGFVIIPAKGSVVTIIQTDSDSGFAIARFGKIDSMQILTDKAALKININAGVIELNGSGHNGILKHDEVKRELLKLKAFMEEMQRMFKAWTPIANDGGAALKLQAQNLELLQRMNLDDLENKKVTHGG